MFPCVVYDTELLFVDRVISNQTKPYTKTLDIESSPNSTLLSPLAPIIWLHYLPLASTDYSPISQVPRIIPKHASSDHRLWEANLCLHPRHPIPATLSPFSASRSHPCAVVFYMDTCVPLTAANRTRSFKYSEARGWNAIYASPVSRLRHHVVPS